MTQENKQPKKREREDKRRTSKRDVGRYHRLPWGGGQITFPKALAQFQTFLDNTDKVLVEYDQIEEKITITRL